MSTFSRQFLTGCPNGTPLALGSEKTLHTAPASANDEVYLFAANNNTSSLELTVTIDGVALAVSLFPKTIALILPGTTLGPAKTILVSGHADLTVFGHVNRIAS